MIASPILLVEDEPNSVFLFEYALNKAEVANPVRIAHDGAEAIDYLDGIGPFADREAFPMPGLILLDLRMPRATGFEVLQHIREQPALRKLIVVMFTASASDEDDSKAYALGANAYLVKPLQLQDLVVVVQSIKEFWLTHNHPPR